MQESLAALVAVLVLAVASLARADEPGPGAGSTLLGPDLELGIDAAVLYGPIHGFVQVPLGGNVGTTSPHRPSLDELGIHNAVLWDVSPRLRWKNLLLFGGYSGLELSSSGVLSQDLVSHGVAFAAGSPFNADIQLNVGNAGAGWIFAFDDGKLRVTPKVDVAILDFSYSLDSPGASAKRAYRVTAGRLGLETSYELPYGFALELDGVASIPVSDWPQLAGVDARVKYRFSVGPVHPALFLGLGGRWIDFHDSQTVPNHINVSTGALVTGGVSVSF